MKKQRTAKYASYIRAGDGAKIYVATVELPADPGTGRRKQRRLTATSHRELDAMVVALKSEVNDGRLITNEMQKWPMSKYLPWWLGERLDKIEESTAHRYADEIKRHIIPVIGNVAVGALTEMHIEQVQKQCIKLGLSPATANLVHGILHTALKDAKRRRIVRENVTDFVEPLKHTPPPTVWWTVRQMAQFLSAVEHDELEAFWRLALLVGLRRGELLAVRWSNLDLEKGILSIQESFSRRGSKYKDGNPKSSSSKARVLLTSTVVNSLLAHKERQLAIREHAGPLYIDNDLVFANAEGGHIHPNTLTYRFKRLTTKAGVPKIRVHDLRHSNGTAMGSTPDITVTMIQTRLRHASPRTSERYIHSDLEGQEAAAQGLEDRITSQDVPPETPVT